MCRQYINRLLGNMYFIITKCVRNMLVLYLAKRLISIKINDVSFKVHSLPQPYSTDNPTFELIFLVVKQLPR